MARKRAPGGGRKPMGKYFGKSETLSTRITPELRRALERERDRKAKRTGKKCSLSQIVEELLRNLLNEPNGSKKALGSRHNHALGRSVSRLARDIEAYTGEQWPKSPFSFETLRSAVETLLSQFAPKGERQVPTQMEDSYAIKLKSYHSIKPHLQKHFPKPTAEQFREPSVVGSSIGLAFWDKLTTTGPPPTGHQSHEYYADDFRDMPDLREEFGLELRRQNN